MGIFSCHTLKLIVNFKHFIMAFLLSILMAFGLVGGSNVNNNTAEDARNVGNHAGTTGASGWDWSNNQ